MDAAYAESSAVLASQPVERAADGERAASTPSGPSTDPSLASNLPSPSGSIGGNSNGVAGSWPGPLSPALPDPGAVPGDGVARMRAAASSLTAIPSIFQRRRPTEPDIEEELGVHVPDWSMVKRTRHGPAPARRACLMAEPALEKASAAAKAKVSKAKGQASGRTYTSKYRGVHQTFPTKRWEAQFRRNGKPTSLGCFDGEEQAARAYDKMMLWCELHNSSGVKGGITNFDPTEYETDLAWLQTVTQARPPSDFFELTKGHTSYQKGKWKEDELVQALRSDGRRQAAQRMLRQKRDGQALAASPELLPYDAALFT